jgi:hypothetical protein
MLLSRLWPAQSAALLGRCAALACCHHAMHSYRPLALHTPLLRSVVCVQISAATRPSPLLLLLLLQQQPG